jgi:hypothetical protein
MNSKWVGVFATAAAIAALASCAPTDPPENLMNKTLKAPLYASKRIGSHQQVICSIGIEGALSYVRARPQYDFCRAMLSKAFQDCADIYDRLGSQWVSDMTNAEVRRRGADDFCGRWYVIRK